MMEHFGSKIIYSNEWMIKINFDFLAPLNLDRTYLARQQKYKDLSNGSTKPTKPKTKKQHGDDVRLNETHPMSYWMKR